MKIISFGFKHGIPQADLVLDARTLRNPYKNPALRRLDGLDTAVQAYVWSDPAAGVLLEQGIRDCLQARDSGNYALAVGCHGGRHRSVVLANAIADRVGMFVSDVTVEHRDMEGG